MSPHSRSTRLYLRLVSVRSSASRTAFGSTDPKGYLTLSLRQQPALSPAVLSFFFLRSAYSLKSSVQTNKLFFLDGALYCSEIQVAIRNLFCSNYIVVM